jgi:hypothetical protein
LIYFRLVIVDEEERLMVQKLTRVKKIAFLAAVAVGAGLLLAACHKKSGTSSSGFPVLTIKGAY